MEVLPKNDKIQTKICYVCTNGVETTDLVEAEIIQAELDFIEWYKASTSNQLFTNQAIYDKELVTPGALICWLRDNENKVLELLRA